MDELKRIYGIKQGGNGYYGNQFEVVTNNSEAPKTQEQLAKEIGMSVDTLQNYKLLAVMIPGLEDLVDTGIITSAKLCALISNNFGRKRMILLKIERL